MIASLREWLYRGQVFRSVDLPAPVWSVGNISLGGTGKSPLVMLLAEWAVEKGLRPLVLTRGYKRKTRRLEIVAPNAEMPAVERLGDEPWMIRHRVPGAGLLVHADRARMAARHWHDLKDPGLVILDDGFQHWPVRRDRDIVMVDAEEPIDGATIPFGRLRESASAFARADLVLITRARSVSPEHLAALEAAIRAAAAEGSRRMAPWQRSRAKRLEVIAADYEFDHFFDATGAPCARPSARELLLAAGVAKPDGVRKLARGLDLPIREETYFPDHHRLTAKDLNRLRRGLASLRDGALLVTEKDWARWRHALGSIPVFGIRVRFSFVGDGEARLRAFLEEAGCSTSR